MVGNTITSRIKNNRHSLSQDRVDRWVRMTQVWCWVGALRIIRIRSNLAKL